MVARLIAVGILPYKAGDVSLRASRRLLGRGEQGVELGRIGLLSAQGGHVSLDVLRDEEAVLPAVGFSKVVVDLAGIERRQPAAVGPRTHEPRGGVEYVTPVGGVAQILILLGTSPQGLCGLGHAPGVVGVLQSLRHGFVLLVRDDAAVLVETVQAVFVLPGRRQHGIQQLGVVHSGDSLREGVCND